MDRRHYWNFEDNTLITLEEYLNKTDREKYIGPIALYRERTYVPENWIPYFTVQTDPQRVKFKLRRGRTMKLSSDETQYKGVLLKESIFLSEESLPRTGVMVLRNTQLARGLDGEICMWNGRYKIIDERRRSSGLQFDYLLK